MDFSNESDFGKIFVNGSDPEGPKYYTDPFEANFHKVLNIIAIYVLPLIIFVGLIGNTISIFVFFRTSLGKNSSSIYLVALAVSDNGFLFTLIFQWLVWFDVQIYHKSIACQCFTYLSNVCAFLSVWYVVSFTVERYIAVFYPLKRQTLCTPARSKIVVCSLAAFSILYYSYHLWTSTITLMYDKAVCSPKLEYYSFIITMNHIDTCVTFVVPFVSISYMNIKITYRITRMFRKQKSHFENSTSFHEFSFMDELDHNLKRLKRADDCPRNNSIARKNSELSSYSARRSLQRNSLRFTGPDRRHSHQLKITRLLLVVSTTFLVLNLPSHAIRLLAYGVVSNKLVLWQELCQLLYYTNFSINIFLYSVCGKSFRQAFVKSSSRFFCKNGNHNFGESCCNPRRRSPHESARTTGLRIHMVDVTYDTNLRRNSSSTVKRNP